MTDTSAYLPDDSLPLRGIKVLELSHMIMGPAGGLVLADLGAEVIKVEPLDGDRTRRLKGSGIGYFPVFSRNKKSLAVDLKSVEGQALVRELAQGCDMLVGELPRRQPAAVRPRLRHAQRDQPRPDLHLAQGLPLGPVQAAHRAGRSRADDGRHGPTSTAAPARRSAWRPSVNDILGGTFGVVGRLAGAARPPAHRPRPARAGGPVREQPPAGGPSSSRSTS
jgi:hypothetical protein